jgi:uncharacterized protein YbbC (DUF1343 family)
MKLGVEKLFSDSKLNKELTGRKISLVCHQASINKSLLHTLDLLAKDPKCQLISVMGPQHGLKTDKQDNMIETDDELHSKYKIPVHSLYGRVREPTSKMMEGWDLMLFDLQDIGCRIYTYVTTLFYCLKACEKYKKEIWILDRPNPVGRRNEGLLLDESMISFVGAASGLQFQHGMTLGELAKFFIKSRSLNLNLKVVEMEAYSPNAAPNYGWPLEVEMPWVNPSPNIPRLSSAQCFPGTVLLEGTTLSEGRGTTRPLELWGAPGVDAEKVIKRMKEKSSEWMEGCYLRPCYFEPSFHKYSGKLCEGFQIHLDAGFFDPKKFRPFRLMMLTFKVLKELYPELMKWRQPPYEYENERLAIDLLSGSSFCRNWVDDNNAEVGDLEQALEQSEKQWEEVRKEFLIYK